MVNHAFRSLGSPIQRIILGLCVIALISLDKNPIVWVEAILGLSPPPLERFLGIKSAFSGMTEGVVQFMNFDLKASFHANVFAPLVLPVTFYLLIIGKVPRIQSKLGEIFCLTAFLIMSVVVNVT